MLSEYEFEIIVNEIAYLYDMLDYKAMETFFYKKLLRDALPRMTDEQRERLYDIFVNAYKYVCNKYGKEPNEDIIDKEKWMSVERGMPTRLSQEEFEAIKNEIENLQSLEKAKEYMDWLKENVFPRATAKQIVEIRKYLEKKIADLKIAEEVRRGIEETKKIKRPPVGTRVEKDGMKGIVVDMAYTTPEVLVKWDFGLRTWEDPRKLKW